MSLRFQHNSPLNIEWYPAQLISNGKVEAYKHNTLNGACESLKMVQLYVTGILISY